MLYLSTFPVGGCWGQLMLLFWKLVHETQISKPLEATRHHISTKLLVFLPLRADLLCTLHYETPCRIHWCEGHWYGSTYKAVRLSDISSKMAKKHKKCICWAIPMPFASMNSTNPRTAPWNFHKKILRIGDFEKWPFFESAILNFIFSKKKKKKNPSFQQKFAHIYRIARIFKNFDD